MPVIYAIFDEISSEEVFMQDKEKWIGEQKFLHIPRKLNSFLRLVLNCRWLVFQWSSPKTRLQSCKHRISLSTVLSMHIQVHSSHKFPSPWWIHVSCPRSVQALPARNLRALGWNSRLITRLMLWSHGILLEDLLIHASIQGLLQPLLLF